MAVITPESLHTYTAGRIRADRAVLYAAALDAALPKAGIDQSPRRVRHFMAQIAVETGYFGSLVESTKYSSAPRLDALFSNVQGPAHAQRLIDAGPEAIGNTIYANKLGNGGPESGDGYRYRGRGFMMITGRSNYRKIGELIGLALEARPELLGEPDAAAVAAVAYWSYRKINLAADAGDRDTDVEAVTLLINAAKLHLKERQEWRRKADPVWP